jgi:GWxTD domain-containing protein
MLPKGARRKPPLPIRAGILLAFLLFTNMSIHPREANASRLDEDPAVRQLRGLLKTTDNPDSIRFLLAVACRRTATLEGRQSALDLLERLRFRYGSRPEYHVELARTYMESGRKDDARRSLKQALLLRPESAEFRIAIARLLFPDIVRFSQVDNVEDALAFLDTALAMDPNNRAALLWRSLYLWVRRSLTQDRWVQDCRQGRADCEALLRQDDRDRTAWLLEGVHCLDLEALSEADVAFRNGLLLSGPEVQNAYVVPALGAPMYVLESIRETPMDRRMSAVLAYWNRMDPTPLTEANEFQLEYWKRMTLADLLYGKAEEGLHGWDTPRGQALVRYGQPRVIEYETGDFTGSAAGGAADVTLRRSRTGGARKAFMFEPPTITWHYDFGGRETALVFVDEALRDDFQPLAPEETKRIYAAIPAVLPGALPGTLRRCFVAAAGVRGDEGKTKESVHIAIPTWAMSRKDWDKGTVRLRVSGQEPAPVFDRQMPLGAATLEPMAPDADLALFSENLLLAPGRYALVVDMEAAGRQGSVTLSLDVRSFAGDSLQLSDLRLVLLPAPSGTGSDRPGRTRSAPNPSALVLQGQSAGVSFELYNLARGSGGTVHYQTRYTILPPEQAGRLVRLPAAGAGAALPPSLSSVAAQALRLTEAEGEPPPENYEDALFPPVETPLAPGSRTIGGFRAGLTSLKTGWYVLVVTVTDLNAGRSVTARKPFRIVDQKEMQDLLRQD